MSNPYFLVKTQKNISFSKHPKTSKKLHFSTKKYFHVKLIFICQIFSPTFLYLISSSLWELSYRMIPYTSKTSSIGIFINGSGLEVTISAKFSFNIFPFIFKYYQNSLNLLLKYPLVPLRLRYLEFETYLAWYMVLGMRHIYSVSLIY